MDSVSKVIPPDEWLKTTFKLVSSTLDQHSEAIESLTTNKVSNKIFYIVLTILFGVAVGVFGLQVANLSVSGKVAARVESYCARQDATLGAFEKYYDQQIAGIKSSCKEHRENKDLHCGSR